MKLFKSGARALVALSMLYGATAAAQSFPTKPVTIVVPYAAGGATDVIARLVGQRLADVCRMQLHDAELPRADLRANSAGER